MPVIILITTAIIIVLGTAIKIHFLKKKQQSVVSFKDKVMLSKYIIAKYVDSNLDDNEFIKRTRQDLSKYPFAKCEVIVNHEDLIPKGVQVGSTLVYRKSGSQDLRENGINYLVINLEALVVEV